jgi:hypothetical protein
MNVRPPKEEEGSLALLGMTEWRKAARLPPTAGKQKDGPYIRRRKTARPPEKGGRGFT